MPIYFFDIHNDGRDAPDDEGSDLASDREAESEAVGLLQDMAKSLVINDDQGDMQTSVRNAAGHVIFRAKLMLTSERVVPVA